MAAGVLAHGFGVPNDRVEQIAVCLEFFGHPLAGVAVDLFGCTAAAEKDQPKEARSGLTVRRTNWNWREIEPNPSLMLALSDRVGAIIQRAADSASC